MARKVVTSKPVNPSAWLLLKQKTRSAIIHATREEVNAKHDRDTKRMELERLSKPPRVSPRSPHAPEGRGLQRNSLMEVGDLTVN